MTLVLWTAVAFFLGIVVALMGVVCANALLYEREKKMLNNKNKTFINTYHNARRADLKVVKEEEDI
jgi:demethoxyubiquinone hydroxylase (CLK1/Coq7/Cat5 family)